MSCAHGIPLNEQCQGCKESAQARDPKYRRTITNEALIAELKTVIEQVAREVPQSLIAQSVAVNATSVIEMLLEHCPDDGARLYAEKK